MQWTLRCRAGEGMVQRLAGCP